jgi:hypothetical protein
VSPAAERRRGDAALVVFGACFGAAMVVEGVAVCTPDPAGGPWVCRCGAPDGGAP